MFRLKLFGGASIDGPDGPVTGRPVQRRRLALLALLALARQRGLTRDKLIGYLWPDADPERARHLLSDSVYRINQAVGGEALIAIGDDLRLNPERLPSDAWEFLDALGRGEWQRAVELHAAPFLDGFFLTDADELERWVDAQRERLARERARALEALAEGAERDGAMADAVRWWRALAAHDPYSSRIALRLLRALDRSGDRAAALRQARQHTRLLEEELGLAPDAELRGLVAELRAPPARPLAAAVEQAPAPADRPESVGGDEVLGPPAAVGPRPRSVAVLPFVNLSADPENEYFADGITEDVIAHLSRIGALSVISRASVMPFKGRERSLREIAAALEVGTLLAGSVRRVADRVRIVAQLVDAGTDRCLWAETYDRQLTDIFAIQTDVALQIAGALEAELSADERSRIRTEPTSSLEAYQLYLKGRHWYIRYTPAAMRRALEYFDRAVASDPTYALAYASSAMAYGEMAENGWLAPDVARRHGREAAAHALRLGPELGETHCTVAYFKSLWELDWAGAEAEFRRAIELSPSGADAYDLYGRMCDALERYDDALSLHRRAQELDPLAHRVDLATTLIRAGRHDEAATEAARALELDPGYDRIHATLGWALFKQGKRDEGLSHLERAVAISSGNPLWLGQLGQALALVGRIDEARDILRRLEERAATAFVAHYHVAYVHTGLGDHDRAIDLLERAFDERAGAVYAIKGSFLFAPLRSHPRFRALLARMNLA
ncbi:MAG TPA: BTAD domain-containing putative transcriptional regulator [Longimicrobiales bacterium]|nr:BTAD domain-containing putative transcriptional regulator [Longimicrobiales bacterium]